MDMCQVASPAEAHKKLYRILCAEEGYERDAHKKLT